ncbi:putative MFS transporter [Aspergillus candidus]|uniref:Major facilitator superfamily domain-containing protein n=1 Tax=Aspergillus candidus TaxID=41067 RepID=A0A2I2FJH4_ASPCN|nr:major facilitator superfamily domain-containing protein [Aspergillus candidus]PLB40760.1 major facilitator superfamily domain-containing protein [Aspergillus candidus]
MSDRSSTHSSITQVPPQALLDNGRGSRHGPYFDSLPNTPNTLVQDQGPMSHHDMAMAKDGYEEKDAAQYERFSPARKAVIVSILSYCAFLAPISSTAILAAVPELAKTYETTSDIINASNALYLAFMGIASTFWGPVSQVWGRRPIFIVSGFLFFAFTLATTLSPNLPVYCVFRVLTAFQGTSFLVVGSSAIGDIYEPRTRASAMGWLLSGSMTGPALGPFFGGVIVTFRPWRVIFWLLTAMTGLACILLIFFFPETIPATTKLELQGRPLPTQAKLLWQRVSPTRVTGLLISYPNLFLTGLAAGALVWNQYALLTPIRSLLNPRFHLTTPIQAGLFYLAPGAGYLAGTFVGGRWADHVVRKSIHRRNGLRIPEDRLLSCLPYICIACPGCILVYGWTVQTEVGGIIVPVLAMFVQGVAQLFCFPSLNTYCLDVMHDKGRSAEVVAGNYVFRYAFAALGTGVALPAIDGLGVGWFNTISALFLALSGGGVWLNAVFGPRWREAIDAKQERKIARQKGIE